MQTETTVEREPKNYLNVEHTLKSWLLTQDHKRICLLYLIVVTIFFFIGGAFAALIRIELATPAGDLVESNVYNKLFTGHGIIMVFFFLIPSIPTTLGNFLIPLMIGAKDVAFPKLNLMSWYLYVIGGSMTLWAIIVGGVDTGWTFYTPFSTGYANGYVTLTALGIFVNGFSSILTGLNFIVTIHRMRAPGMTWFRLPLFIWSLYATSLIQVLGTPVIAVTLLLLGLERGLHIGIFRSRARRRSCLVSAPLLVLLAPRRVHHDSSGSGRYQRDHYNLLQEGTVRIQFYRLLQRGHRGVRLHRVGTPHVREQPIRLRRHGVFRAQLSCRDPFCDQSLQLDLNHV